MFCDYDLSFIEVTEVARGDFLLYPEMCVCIYIYFTINHIDGYLEVKKKL